MHYHIPKPFYRKSRNRWYVQLEGKQINLGADRDAAFAEYYRVMADAQSSEPVKPLEQPDGDLQVAVLCDYFLEWVIQNRSPETYEWYRYRLQRFLDQYPSMTVSELKPYHVEQWVAAYKLSQTSRRNYFRAVKRCFIWALRQGYVQKNPVAALEVPAGDRREQYVSQIEFASLLEYVTDENLRELMVATYTTGCRPQESLRLQTRHVDLKNKRWLFPQSEEKNKRQPRIVYLSDEALEITKRRMNPRNLNSYVFTNTGGRAWTTDAVNCALERLRSRMGKAEMEKQGISIDSKEIESLMKKLCPTYRSRGVEKIKPKWRLRAEAKRKLVQQAVKSLVPRYSLYAFRHSWATNALKAGVDSLTVAILMGHNDPSMLAKVYQHLGHNPEHMLEQARRASDRKSA